MINTYLMYPKVTRKAILIGCPGGLSNRTRYLTGVKRDLENIKRFLMSQRGGAWREDEIITINSGWHAEVTKAVQDCNADYVFVYYSGHGFSNSANKRAICLQNKNISASSLFTNSSKQLVIIDACGSYSSASIGAIDQDAWLPFDGYSLAREKFDHFILNSPNGEMMLFASQNGYSTNDTSSGGEFTNALIRSAKSSRQISSYSPLMIEEIVQKIPKRDIDNNTPFFYKSGNLTVPFALSMEDVEKSQNISYSITPKATQQGINWGGIALFALAIYGVSTVFNGKK